MPYKYWDELPTTAFKDFDPKKTVVIMPVASTEQHGPHLPLSVDVRITEGVLNQMHRTVPDDYTILSLPTMPIGKANEHIGYDGTLSLSINTLMGLWTDVAESVFRTGLKKLMILNGHGGQSQVAEIVARDLRVRHNALVVPVNWWSVREKPIEFSDDEYTYGIHGGSEETSVMLHLHPNLVKNDCCVNFIPNSLLQKNKFPRLFSQGVRHAWKAEDLHHQGAMGDASKANSDDGIKIIQNAAVALIELLREMIEFELPLQQDTD